MKEKHLPYFKVLDSFKARECPVCNLINERLEKYFEGLLYEGINDVAFRKRFREDGGFCNYHSYKFLSYSDGLALSLTHRDLIANKIGELKGKKIEYSLRRKTLKCLVCERSIEWEERYLSIIGEYAEDGEFKNKFLNSEGLCFPHYKNYLKEIRFAPDWFVEFHIHRYTELLSKVDKYINSCNFSLGEKRPSLSRDEELIWQKAVKILFGFEGKQATK